MAAFSCIRQVFDLNQPAALDELKAENNQCKRRRENRHCDKENALCKTSGVLEKVVVKKGHLLALSEQRKR